jgi:hypothetical protein
MTRVMSSLVVVAAVVAMVLAWLLWREHGELLAAQAEVAQARSMRTQSISRPTELPPVRANSPEPSSVRAETPAVATPAAPAPRVFTESERRARVQLTEYRRWMTLAKKADLLSGLNLPPEKLAALKDLLIERDFAERDAREAAKSAGVNPNDAAASETEKIDLRIQTMLGEADYPKYADAMSTETFRQTLESNPLVGSLVDAGAPLTPEQKTWVAQVMNRTITPVAKAAADNPGGPAPDPDVQRLAFQQAVLTQGPGVLTPAQLDVLREFFQKDNELGANLKIMRDERRPK